MPGQVTQIIKESSIIEQIANIKIAAKVSSVFDTGLDLSNQEKLIDQLTGLVQLGLTTYNSPENFEDAKRDLIKHVQGQQVEILYDKDDNPIAFGVYALHESQAYFEIARIVHPDFQDKKLGKYFVLSGCQRNAELPYLVSSTQNQRAFFSIQSALGKNNMISPKISEGKFQTLDQDKQNIVKEIANLRETEYTTNNGTLPNYYQKTLGLYNQNINITEMFPINTDSNADAILIVAKNPFYNNSK